MSKKPYKTRSITIPAALDEEILERTQKGGYSAYVRNALENQLRHDALRELLADARPSTPITDELREEVRAALRS